MTTTVHGHPSEISFSNISATPSAFFLGGGLYGVTVMGTGFGTVTLQRLAADGSTYVTCLTAFSANGYATVYLPKGQYQLTISSTTAVYADITAVVEP
jgi:hypothetical protein